MIFKVLDVSSAHMTEDDNDCLSYHDYLNVNDERIPVLMTTNGYMIPTFIVPEGPHQDDVVSRAFLDVMLYAYDMGCDYVWFDGDGTVYPNLPVFEW